MEEGVLRFVFLSVYLVNFVVYSQFYGQPEQVHLSYGASPTEMTVTWVTLSQVNASVVEYGIDNLIMVAKGSETAFEDGGTEKRVIYIHRVTLTNLIPGQRYIYHCGSSYGWSSMFWFNAMKDGNQWSPRFAVFGDFGNENAQSLSRLQEETQRGHFDAILHVGDFAYNMDTSNARVGDEFMKQIETVAAYIPYMTCPGNHEQQYNFSNYKARFSMPGGDGQSMFYSFDVGPAHIIAFSTEFYYFLKNYGWMQIARQYKWLSEDLEAANLPENRAKRPWVITMGHRPMYCSNSDDVEHCRNFTTNMARTGLPYINAYGLEDLFYKYGVDLMFEAHEHSYERMWPVYNLTVCNGSDPLNPYINPPGPVHIVTGSAGCHEGEDPFIPVELPWSAAHSDDYGYTRMNILNATHLYLEQVSDDKGGQVIDKMMYIKSRHGAGLYTCHLKK